jgi:hypothetical protein
MVLGVRVEVFSRRVWRWLGVIGGSAWSSRSSEMHMCLRTILGVLVRALSTTSNLIYQKGNICDNISSLVSSGTDPRSFIAIPRPP